MSSVFELSDPPKKIQRFTKISSDPGLPVQDFNFQQIRVRGTGSGECPGPETAERMF